MELNRGERFLLNHPPNHNPMNRLRRVIKIKIRIRRNALKSVPFSDGPLFGEF